MKSRGRRPQILPLANRVEIAELQVLGIVALARNGTGGIEQLRQRSGRTSSLETDRHKAV